MTSVDWDAMLCSYWEGVYKVGEGAYQNDMRAVVRVTAVSSRQHHPAVSQSRRPRRLGVRVPGPYLGIPPRLHKQLRPPTGGPHRSMGESRSRHHPGGAGGSE